MSWDGGRAVRLEGLLETPISLGLVWGCWVTIRALVTGAGLVVLGGQAGLCQQYC